jgi:hypothetical protein
MAALLDISGLLEEGRCLGVPFLAEQGLAKIKVCQDVRGVPLQKFAEIPLGCRPIVAAKFTDRSVAKVVSGWRRVLCKAGDRQKGQAADPNCLTKQCASSLLAMEMHDNPSSEYSPYRGRVTE